jgi:ribosomal protein S18 acetylase RimI-like enzyme
MPIICAPRYVKDMTGRTKPRFGTASRIVRSLRKRGPAETARLAAEKAWSRGRTALYVDESHIWYSMSLAGDVRISHLPTGMDLVAVSAEQIDVLLDTPFHDRATAHQALEQGGACGWSLREHGRTIFSCWTFAARVPAVQAVGGWLELPANVDFLENSVAAPDQRGRRLAATTWSVTCNRLRARGASALFTKVEVGNAPARKAVERFGFQTVATTRFRRRAGFRRLQNIAARSERCVARSRAVNEELTQPGTRPSS